MGFHNQSMGKPGTLSLARQPRHPILAPRFDPDHPENTPVEKRTVLTDPGAMMMRDHLRHINQEGPHGDTDPDERGTHVAYA
jgi:hypothetical protein